MINWRDMSELEVYEALANWEDMIDSEEKLSNKFDDEVADDIAKQYGEDDTVAMTEGFSDWADSLTGEGELSSVQYENYSYIGKYS